MEGNRDGSVGIANDYGLDGPGIKSRWGRVYTAPVQKGSEAHSPTYTMGTGSFAGVKRPRRGVDHPPHLALRLKRAELYLYSLSGSLWPVLV
jgi:hypothetical protein